MSSAAENGDAAPGKQNEEKTYKKVSECFILFLQLRKNTFTVWNVKIVIGLSVLQSSLCKLLP